MQCKHLCNLSAHQPGLGYMSIGALNIKTALVADNKTALLPPPTPKYKHTSPSRIGVCFVVVSCQPYPKYSSKVLIGTEKKQYNFSVLAYLRSLSMKYTIYYSICF